MSKQKDTPLVCDLCSLDDFTFYKRRDRSTEELLKRYCSPRGSEQERPLSYEGRMPIKDKNGDILWGRVIACSAFDGIYWSVTFRKEPEERNRVSERATKRRRKAESYQARRRLGVSKYRASNTLKVGTLNSIKEICNAIYERLFPEKGRHYIGIVIVTGRTGSAKSQIARGLIHRYLTQLTDQIAADTKSPSNPRKRRPHLVTFEDPIEVYYFEPKDPSKSQEYGLDYTPRQSVTDAGHLRSVISDALRQTLTVFFVGETRKHEDWKELVGFAGTGHLVFTTAHAGSLSEAMGNILAATQTQTPAQRSVIADRLLALIHLKPSEIAGKSIIIPAMWVHTAGGAKALMAEGRASLLPNNPTDHPTPADPGKPRSVRPARCQPSSVGRRWFAEELTKNVGEEERRKILTEAVKWDLEGI